MSAKKKKKANKPTPEEQESGIYVQVEGDRGIYRYKDQNDNITYHERPWINGKRTWRSLGFDFTAQSSLKLAREEYHRRRTAVSAGKNPYTVSAPGDSKNGNSNETTSTHESAPSVSTSNGTSGQSIQAGDTLSVSGILIKYRDDGFPDKYLAVRDGRMLEIEERNCSVMLEYFNGQPWDELLPPLWDKYKEWRVDRIPKRELERIEKEKQREQEEKQRRKNGHKKKRKKKKQNAKTKVERTKHRTVDQERNTMLNAYKYVFRKGLITAIPARDLPRFQPSSEVQHCREFCPQNADELHEIAKLLFKKRSSEVLAWQLLFEAYTGLRTEEALNLRTDAKPEEPGFVRPDGNMDVYRSKKGANPYVFIHDGLKELLDAHAKWKAVRYPKSPWYFPGREEPDLKPVDKQALAHRLWQLRKQIGRKITSHGMRAWYVLIRRSHGTPDSCIAWEIGHTSGGVLIAQVYGTVPSSWMNGGGPKLKWLPEGDPAWTVIAPFTSPRFRRATKSKA
jgi:hypothetical protein